LKISRDAQARISHQPVAHVTRLNSLLECPCLFLQCHRLPFQARDALAGSNPNDTFSGRFVDINILDRIILQPAASGEVLPSVPAMLSLAIKTRGALIAAQPDRA